MAMPTVKRWADDLRAVFGTAEFNAGLRSQGFFASEGGEVVNTLKPLGRIEVALSNIVIGDAPVPVKRGARGR
jgi:hypothetical protein